MTINDDLPKDPITFYVRLSNLHTMKLHGKTLNNILHQHVMPAGTDQKIKLISYFRPRKLGSCFSIRPPKIDPDRVSVVYQFSCTEVGCQATYIGHTACTLRKRRLQHKYSISTIHKHYINDHLLSCVPTSRIISLCCKIFMTSASCELQKLFLKITHY